MVADCGARIAAAQGTNTPIVRTLYVDLLPEIDAALCPIHLGFASGTDFLHQYLGEARRFGVNYVALNIRFNGADIEETMRRIADDLLPGFSL